MKIEDTLDKIKMLFESTLASQPLLQQKSSSGLTRDQLKNVIEAISSIKSNLGALNIDDNQLPKEVEEAIETVNGIFARNVN